MLINSQPNTKASRRQVFGVLFVVLAMVFVAVDRGMDLGFTEPGMAYAESCESTQVSP